MRFSAKGRYAMRAMIDLALHEQDAPISAKAIAERQDFSADYLEQILRLLRQSGLVVSRRGPTGGFNLARPSFEISVWDIMDAIDEPLQVAPCFPHNLPDRECDCDRVTFCAARLLWDRVGRDMRRILSETTLDDIVSEAREKLQNHPLHAHMFHI